MAQHLVPTYQPICWILLQVAYVSPQSRCAKMQALAQILGIAVGVQDHSIRATDAAADVDGSNLLVTFSIKVQEVLRQGEWANHVV